MCISFLKYLKAVADPDIYLLGALTADEGTLFSHVSNQPNFSDKKGGGRGSSRCLGKCYVIEIVFNVLSY